MVDDPPRSVRSVDEPEDEETNKPCSSSSSSPTRPRSPGHERRLRKWRKMVGAGLSDWWAFVQKHPHKLRKRVHKGVPDTLRGVVWQLLSGSRHLVVQNQGIYSQLVFQSSASENDIIRDLSRTFPSHVYYKQRHGPGQRALYNVLKAFSVYDREVGYVQGMGFITALLLLYMGEEDAFWLLVALMKGAIHAPLEGLYRPGMPLVQLSQYQFERLLEERCPQLAKHLKQESIHPSMYCAQWFITLFAYSLPFDLVLRIWDTFILEGISVVFRVGLALLAAVQDQLLAMPFERLVSALRHVRELAFDPDQVLKNAATLVLTAERLQELQAEYEGATTRGRQHQEPTTTDEGQRVSDLKT